jgi:hypothetical protein
MFLLSLVPFVFGYLVVTRLLRERDRHLHIPVAYGLGLVLFLFGVNIGFHFTSLRQSVYVTLGAMMVGGIGLAWRRPVRASSSRLGTLEDVFLVVFTSTVFFWTLFWHMKFSDDDFFPHSALMALYLRDIFPPRNPLYPDVLLFGHYGRDLTIAALSVLFRERFFEVQYVLTSLNQVSIGLFGYFLTRRYVGSAGAAALAVVLPFVGINSAFRFGILEATGNNNSFAYLYLLLNSYLYLVAVLRRDLASTLVCIVSVATYAIVYESHFGVLLIVFSLFPVAVLVRRWRWRVSYVGVAAAIVTAALVIALFEGGTLTDVARRHLFRSASPHGSAGPADMALTNQEVRMGFPKRHFRITSFDGSEYGLLSGKLVSEAGYSLTLLPGLGVLMVVVGCWWGIFLALVAVVAVLIPAAVDFGAFNGESFRFLFFSGVATTMLLGIALGLGLQWLRRRGHRTLWPALAVAACVALVSSSGLRRVGSDFLEVSQHPATFYWHGEEWACHGTSRMFCDPLDASAAITLRSVTKKGDTILTNVSSQPATVPHKRKTRRDVIAHSIVSALSQAFVTGHGVRVSKQRLLAMGMEYRESQGFRAIAFWNTLDRSLLRAMSVTHLLVDPARLPRHSYEKIKQERWLELVDRQEDARRGAVREVYRVDATDLSPPASPARLSLVAVEAPAVSAPAMFHAVPFVVASAADDLTGSITIGYRVFYGDLQMNANDEIRHVTELASVAPGRWRGTMYFVAPFETGTYDVVLYAMQADGWAPLRPEAESRGTFSLTVSDPRQSAVASPGHDRST